MNYFKINFWFLMSLFLVLAFILKGPKEVAQIKEVKNSQIQTKEVLNTMDFIKKAAPSRIIGGDNTMASKKL